MFVWCLLVAACPQGAFANGFMLYCTQGRSSPLLFQMSYNIIETLAQLYFGCDLLSSSGNGNFLRAFEELGIKASILIRAAACENRLTQPFIDYLATSENTSKPYHISRGDIGLACRSSGCNSVWW